MPSHHLDLMADEIERAARQRSTEARWHDPERGWPQGTGVVPASPTTGYQRLQPLWRCWQRRRGGPGGGAEAARPTRLYELAQG